MYQRHDDKTQKYGKIDRVHILVIHQTNMNLKFKTFSSCWFGLANELKHQIYITTVNEPSGNHHIEAAKVAYQFYI